MPDDAVTELALDPRSAVVALTHDPKLDDLALLEALANGTQLTTGQADLVRSMASSGRRVELAIAPAGSGKTTAMRTLGAAWTEAGGTVVGLAPSAAAATGVPAASCAR